ITRRGRDLRGIGFEWLDCQIDSLCSSATRSKCGERSSYRTERCATFFDEKQAIVRNFSERAAQLQRSIPYATLVSSTKSRTVWKRRLAKRSEQKIMRAATVIS